MYNANMPFPLKTVMGAERTGQMTWGVTGLHLMKALSLNTSLGKNVAGYISEKAMAPHSSTLAWELPWTEEPGRLQPMVSRRVRHD